MKNVMYTLLILFSVITISKAEGREKIAILSIDTKNLNLDEEQVSDLTRMEMEKLNIMEVMDKYDMQDMMNANNINICYGKTCLVDIGKQFNVDQMLTGSIMSIGSKIIITLRQIDVKKETVINSSVVEYLNSEEHLQLMIQISIKKLFNLEVDPNLANMLINYDNPLNTPQTRLKLDGPRIGIAYISGDMGKRLKDPISDGGYDALPVMSQFGYQFETQYLSAGNFQALLEYVLMFSGMEQQLFIPSFTFMNGFRSNSLGIEFAFGPSISLRKSATGFYDASNNWHLEYEKYDLDNSGKPIYSSPDIVSRMDKRGDIKFTSGWVWSVGKTFRSGYLNIPVNLYITPKKEGSYIGTSIGFNINKQKK